MKTHSFTILFISLLTIGLISCQSDEAVSPQQDERDKFIGTWNVSSNGSVSGPLNYSIVISASSSNPAQILMDQFDFRSPGVITTGDVAGNNIVIYPQLINGDTINGTGNYANSKITFTYTVKDGIETDVVTATATK
jgi:hypothetical protein